MHEEYISCHIKTDMTNIPTFFQKKDICEIYRARNPVCLNSIVFYVTAFIFSTNIL